MENQEYLSNILTTALDHAYEGVVVVNEKAEIIHFNEAYCRLKGIKKEAAIGRHVADVIENTKLHHILKTGVPERGVLQRIAGQDMVVHRIPVWQDGKVVAAIGMLVFEGISELYQILEKVEEHHEGEEGSRKLFPVQKERKGTNFHFDEIIGRSETILKTRETARKAAKNN
ncbi:MAG: PAS domain-containing protein [Bacillus sp. (in: Bacteria)]|nr:PAS domain-containing protein [Bacillus sp. (in: firmicutes)]